MIFNYCIQLKIGIKKLIKIKSRYSGEVQYFLNNLFLQLKNFLSNYNSYYQEVKKTFNSRIMNYL